MLTEDQVNTRMQRWLEDKQGYTIKDRHPGTSPGYDIIATKDNTTMLVECKGARSARTGRAFNRNQETWSRVTEAVFKAIQAKYKAENRNATPPPVIALALPLTDYYRFYLDGIVDFFRDNHIKVYLVPENENEDPRELEEFQVTRR